MREARPDIFRTIFKKSVKFLWYADDIVIVGRSVGVIVQTFLNVATEIKSLRLNVNEPKTKCMLSSQNKEYLVLIWRMEHTGLIQWTRLFT